MGGAVASGALAMVGAYTYWDLRVVEGWSFWPAFLATTAILAAAGAGIDVVEMRRLRRASTMAAVVATLGAD